MPKETVPSGASSNLEELRGLFDVVAKGKRDWESTFDAILDPVLIVTEDYQVERANLAAAHSAAIDVKKLIGKKCYQIFAMREKPCEGCPMKTSQENRSPGRHRLQPFPDRREFVASAFPVLKREPGEAEITVMQYQDISQIRKLEEQLMQSEKMAALGLFASGIAHDINNPLTGVLAFAQLAMQGMEKDSQTYQDIKEIETSALRCKQIIEDLLGFSRPLDKGQTSQVDLAQLIERVLPNLKVQFKDQDFQIKTDLKKLVPIEACESKIQQVLTNLITNALQAIESVGEVSIQGKQTEDGVLIEVVDTGKGISEENLKSIFDPYFTTRKASGGTGLGLTICYHIIREHGGSIEVESQEGRGTTFRVFIPKGGSS